MQDLKYPHIFVKRNCKYLVCKWGSGKRNYSAAKYVLWILSCESQKTWDGSGFSVRISSAVHGMMDCGCEYHCGQSGKERWALPIGTERTQWAWHSIHAMIWASVPPLVTGNLLSPCHAAEPKFFCILFTIYWSTRNWIILTSVLSWGDSREEERLTSFFLAALVQWHPHRGVLSWLE